MSQTQAKFDTSPSSSPTRREVRSVSQRLAANSSSLSAIKAEPLRCAGEVWGFPDNDASGHLIVRCRAKFCRVEGVMVYHRFDLSLPRREANETFETWLVEYRSLRELLEEDKQ